MTFSNLHIETTKRLAAQRQIDAAVSHLHKSELESAITLATAPKVYYQTRGVEGFLHICLSKQVDLDKTIDWLKRSGPAGRRNNF